MSEKRKNRYDESHQKHVFLKIDGTIIVLGNAKNPCRFRQKLQQDNAFLLYFQREFV